MSENRTCVLRNSATVALEAMEWSPGDESPWDTATDVPDPVCVEIIGVQSTAWKDDEVPHVWGEASVQSVIFLSKNDTLKKIDRMFSSDFNFRRFNVRELR